MSDVDLVLACYAAYPRDDIPAAVAVMHENVDWIEPEVFPNGGARRGRAAVADYLRQSRGRWATLTVEPHAYERDGKVVVVVRHHGRLVTGEARDVTVADVFTVEGGEVVHMQAYADPREALPDAGD